MSNQTHFRRLAGVLIAFFALFSGGKAWGNALADIFPPGFHYSENYHDPNRTTVSGANFAVGIDKTVIQPQDRIKMRYVFWLGSVDTVIIGGKVEHDLSAFNPVAQINIDGPTCVNNAEDVLFNEFNSGTVTTTGRVVKWDGFTFTQPATSAFDDSKLTYCYFEARFTVGGTIAPGEYTFTTTQPTVARDSVWQIGNRTINKAKPQSLTITVPGQQIAAADGSFYEQAYDKPLGNTMLNIPFTFTPSVLPHDVEFDVQLIEQTDVRGAKPNTHYNPAAMTNVRIPSGTRSGDYQLPLPLLSGVQSPDTLDPQRCFTVRIHNVRGATLPTRTGLETEQRVNACILDFLNFAGLPELQPATDAGGPESAEYIDLPLRLVDGRGNPTTSGLSVKFDFEVLEDTARAGKHFQPRRGRATIPANNSAWGVRTWLTNETRQDGHRGPDRTFKVRLSNPENIQLPGNARFIERTVTIRDDDPGELPTLTGPAYNIVKANESDRIIDVPVQLSGASSRPVSWDFEVVPHQPRSNFFQAAVDGVHFYARSGSVTMPPGSPRWGVRIWTPPDADDGVTPKRFIDVRIFNIRNARFENLYEDELVVRVSINDNDFGGDGRAQQAQSDEIQMAVSTPSPSLRAGEDAVFVISASETPRANLTVAIDVSETAPSRLSAIPSQVVLPAGQGRVDLTLATTDEMADAADTTVTLTLPEPGAEAGYALTTTATDITVDNTASVTLTDDNVPALSLSDAVLAAEDQAQFVVTASRAPPEDLSVALDVERSGAAGMAATSVTIAGRQLSATLSVTVTGGERVEARFLPDPQNDYVVNPSAARASLAPAAAGGPVNDNEENAPTVTITAQRGAVVEGKDAVFEVTASEAPAMGLTIALAQQRISGESFVQTTNLVLGAGEASGTLTIATEEESESDAQRNEFGERRANLVVVAVLDERGYEPGTPGVAEVSVQDASFSDREAQELNQSIMPYVALAMADETAGAVQNRLKTAFAGNRQGLVLEGQGLSRFVENLVTKAAGPARAENLGDLPAFDVFDDGYSGGPARFTLPGDMAFSFAADEGGESAGRGHRFTLWSRGFHHRIDVERDDAPDFDGEITGGMLGMDVTGLKPGLVLGLGVSHSRSVMDFEQNEGISLDPDLGGLSREDRDIARRNLGEHKTYLTGFHPYFGWQAAADGSHLWGALGYAIGDVEITRVGTANDYDKAEVDLEQKMLSLGGYKPMAGAADGKWRLGVVGDGLYTDMDSDAGGKVDAARIRVGLEMDYGHNLSDDRRVDGNLKLTGRHDFGDTQDGLGMEMSGKLDYAVPSLGLRLDAQARGLLMHEHEVREWGVSGGMMWAASGGGRGLALTLRPHLGMTGERSGEFWQAGHADFDQAAAFSSGYDLELKYGLPVWKDREVLNFFARDRLRDDVRSLALGADFKFGSYFSAGYEAVRQRQAALEREMDHRAYIRYKKGF